jgi:aspartate/tyrosine/aromatic aminotransferase
MFIKNVRMAIKDKGLSWSKRIVKDEDINKIFSNIIVYVQADEANPLLDELETVNQM